jgi:hypothetical protein
MITKVKGNSFVSMLPIKNQRRHLKQRTKQRTIPNSFFFTVGGKMVKMCKDFFKKLSMSVPKQLQTQLSTKCRGYMLEMAREGKVCLRNRTTEYHRSFLKKHIESFPTVESHYTQKDSNRKYLTQDLSIRRMYSLYVEKCKGQKYRKCISEAVYRKIFCTEYNLFCFHPKKGQCQLCNMYDALKIKEQKQNIRHTKKEKQCQNGKISR